MVFEKIKEILAERLGIDEEKITRETSFEDDLETDSLDLLTLVLAVDREFGVRIPLKDFIELKNMGQVADYIESHREKDCN